MSLARQEAIMDLPKSERPRSAAVLVAISLAGCAATPPELKPEPYEAQKAAIGIEVSLQAPAGSLRNAAEVVYFTTLDAGSGAPGTRLITSSYSKDGRVYLLNVPPGTYVAVAARFSNRSSASTMMGISTKLYTTYFSKRLIERTKTTVQESGFAFMGSYVVDQSTPMFNMPDEAQARYLRLVESQAAKDGPGMFPPAVVHYFGSMLESKSDQEARSNFVRKAKGDLMESTWVERIR
jgi:hypothetical protein